MANNPIDTNSFRHFLLIRGVEYEINEPVNFDKSNFRCIQGNYARDTFYGNEEELLEFYQNYGQQGQTYLNNEGVLISHLSSGLDLLLQENKDNGSESDVKYILKKDNVSFTTGNFDFSNAETDNLTYFKCKVIQNTNQAKIKKREKLNVDLLATTDLDDNTISAIPIQRMLLKAKPVYGSGVFEYDRQDVNILGGTGGVFENRFNFTPNIKDISLESTLSFLSGNGQRSDFNYLVAKDDLSNAKIKIDADVRYSCNNNTNSDFGFVNIYYYIGASLPNTGFFDQITPIFSDSLSFNNDKQQTSYIDTFEFSVPAIPSGHKVWIWFENSATTSISGFFITTKVNKFNVEITATATALDSVINAVRWIDVIKQNYKAIGSLPVNAPKFDVGGELYDNFCFTKNLIKQDLTKPFNIKLTDTIESLQEVNGDAQINNNEIFGGTYVDFYRNSDMGGFLIKPDVDSAFSKNERYLVNEFNYGYEKYEQDRNEKNTIDAIHTDSQFFPQTQNSINTKEVKLPFVRDAFSIETARKSAFSINNNSDSTDDNIFIVDVIQLAPNTRRKFTRLISYQTNSSEGSVKFLSDNTFRWDLLGFSVGDTIIVNNVSRTVLEITPSILKCTFTGPDFSDTIFQTFDYPLTNVLFTNRTNEGLIFSENLRNADNFSNLRRSIKRNILQYWLPVLSTYGKFILNKKIKNTFFKANGEATTQFTGEIAPIKENADILVSDIAELKILNQDLFKTRVSCEFQQAVQLLNDVQNLRGFVRVQSPDGSIIKGYIKEANFVCSLDELDLTLECKNESDFLTVDYSGGILTINEVGYNEKMANIKLYNIFNDYIQFFDTNNVNLCNRTKFDKVLLNGVSYENVTDLVNAIALL